MVPILVNGRVAVTRLNLYTSRRFLMGSREVSRALTDDGWVLARRLVRSIERQAGIRLSER